MGVVNFPQVASGLSTEQLADLVARMIKEVEWLANGNIDSGNVRNIAGYNVDRYTLKHESGIVGLSGANPTTSTAIRFWAGNSDPTVAPFRVQQDGSVFGSNMTVEGGVIRTNVSTGARIELSGNSLQTYNAANVLSGFAWGSAVSGTTFGDAYMYSGGSKALEFYDNVGSYIIRGAVGATGFYLGGNSVTTYASGTWAFSGYNGVLKANGSGALSAISGVSGTVYVASTSGGSPTTPITFTNGIRTA